MHTAIEIALRIFLVVGLVGGLIAVPLGLSGNFIIVGVALLYDLAFGFEVFGPVWLVVFLIAAVLGEVVESLLGVVAARRYGAGRWGMLGAFVGGVVGAIAGSGVLPIIGTILGSFVGAFGGALAGEYLARREEPDGLRGGMRAGWGAFAGRVAAIGVKSAIGVAMVAVALVRAFGGGT